MNPACGREQMDAFIAHIRGCPLTGRLSVSCFVFLHYLNQLNRKELLAICA
jgi:hypothetical protein